MTVPDCMLEYKTLASKVFGRPQIFTKIHFGLRDRPKYKAENLRKAFEDITERRSTRTDQKITLSSKRGLCKTLVPFSFSYNRHGTITLS